MTSLDRVTGVNPDLVAFLGAVGVLSAEDLANAEATRLQQDLDQLGRKRGRVSQVPSLVTVKLWVQAAKKLTSKNAPAQPSLDDIPEAINLDDIPEAQVDTSDPGYYGAKASETRPEPRPSFGDQFQNAARPQRSSGMAGTVVQADAAPTGDLWKSLDKTRFQSLDDYTTAGRGIEPLKRNPSDSTDGPAKVSIDSKGKLSRMTRRGVLYPFPGKALAGAFASLAWRLGLLGTCILLPLYLMFNSTAESRPVEETLLWLGGLMILAVMQLWAISKVRCRVCSCQLFFSKRCFKNSKAHHLPLLGYVGSLSLHMIVFQWFRCMYCGTAIRLFGGKSKSASVVPPEDVSAE